MENQYNLYIADKKFSELLAIFMIDIENDSDFYETISINLLKYFGEDTINIYNSFNDERKSSILRSFHAFNKRNLYKEFLTKELHSKRNCIVSAAIEAISYLSSDNNSVIEPFLDSKITDIKTSAIKYFAKKEGLNFKPRLLDLLNDPNPTIRECVLDELDFLCYDNITMDIQHCLNDKSRNIRILTQDIINRNKFLSD